MTQNNTALPQEEKKIRGQKAQRSALFWLVHVVLLLALIRIPSNFTLALYLILGFILLGSFHYWRTFVDNSVFPIHLIFALVLLVLGIQGFQNNRKSSDLRVFKYGLDDVTSLQTLKIYMLSSAIIALGALLFQSKSVSAIDSNIKDFRIIGDSNTKFTFVHLLPFILGCIGSIVYIWETGFSNLISRNYYIRLDDHVISNSILNLATISMLLSIAGVSYSYSAFSGIYKTFALLIFVTIVTIGFAKGSRITAIFVFIWVFQIWFINQTRRNTLLLLTSTPLIILISNLMVFFRSQESHGLIPQLTYLSQFDWWNVTNWTTSNVGSYSYSVTGYAGVLSPDIPKEFFFISIDPRPGFYTEWYSIASSLRFNFYIPFTGLGELWNYGILFFCFYFLLFSVTLGKITRGFLNSKSENWKKLLFTSALGSLSLSFLMLLQYNLRSSSRFLLLSILLLIISTFSAKIKA